MQKRSSLLAVALFGLITVSVPTVASAESPKDKELLLDYSCEGLAAFIPADSKVVREVGGIPQDFTLQGEATGKTVLFFWQLLCDLFEGGKPLGTGSSSGLSVNLQSAPPECSNCRPGAYDIWQVGNDPDNHAALTRLGIFAPLVRGTSVSFSYVNGAPVAAKVLVPWDKSPYELTAAISPPVLPFFAGIDDCGAFPMPTADPAGCFPSDHWFKGDQGIVYTANANCKVEAAPAQMRIKAKPGSPLALMLGATQLEVPGGWIRINSGRSRSTFAERFQSGEVSRPVCST